MVVLGHQKYQMPSVSLDGEILEHVSFHKEKEEQFSRSEADTTVDKEDHRIHKPCDGFTLCDHLQRV